MSDKRQKKLAKRNRRKAAEERSEQRREQRLAAPLSLREGQEALGRVDEFFAGYFRDPAPEEFMEILDIIDRLNLLRLETHRHAIGAAVASVYRMHPEQHKKWRGDGRRLGLLGSAERICPDPEDGVWVIEHPTHIDQAMIQFLVTGDERFLESLWVAAHEEAEDNLHLHAARSLQVYAQTTPEVAEWLQQQRPPKATSSDLHRIPQLAERLKKHPEQHRIAFCAWSPDEGAIVIGTMDAGPMSDVPDQWYGEPVLVRQALPEERRLYRRWRDAQEEPI